jgi:hypothetical protein
MERRAYLQDLRNRAWEGAKTGRGGLTDGELDWLVQELQQSTDPGEQASIIKTLAIVGKLAHKPLIESFLAGPEPDPAHMALFVLCRYWDLTADYIDVIADFIRGIEWDTDWGECRLWATSIAQDYLLGTLEPKLVDALLHVAEDAQLDEETRSNAYQALQTIFGTSEMSKAQVLERAREITTHQGQ